MLKPSFLALEKVDQQKFEALTRKVETLTWDQVYRDSGLKWELISSPPFDAPAGVDNLYSVRISRSRRAIAYRKAQMMVFMLIARDHDSTYRMH